MTPQGGYYYVNSIGQVATDSNPRYIDAPIGWDQTEIKWLRHPTYWGIGRTLTTPYQMHTDAARIVCHVYLTQGIEGDAILSIEIREPGQWLYVPYYSGAIDFSKFDGDPDLPQVQILESNVQALLKANERVPQEITIGDADCLSVKMDGVQLLNSASFIMSNNPLGDNINIANVPKITLVATETGDDQDVQNVDYSDVASLQFAGKHFFQASTPTIITVDYDFEITGTAIASPLAAVYRVGFFVKDSAGVTGFINDIISENNYLNFDGLTFSPSGSFSVTMQPGDKLYFRASMTTPNPGADWNYGIPVNSTPSIKISFSSLYPETTIKAYRYWQLWAKIVGQAIGQSVAGTSTLLTNSGFSRNAFWDSRPYNTAVTCGDAVRGLPDAKIKTTIADVFQDASTQWSMGLIEVTNTLNPGGELALVPLAEVFQNTEIANLGEVTDLKTPPYNDVFVNKVQIGYQARDYDQLNGRFEYNQGQTLTHGFTRNQEEADRLSSFRADSIGIEFIRRNLANKTTTDSGSDNDTILIDISNTQVNGAWTIYRPNTFLNTSGVPFPGSVYNIALTPHRKQLRGARLEAAIMHLRNSDIIFKTGDKNVDLVSNIGAGTVSEKADIPNSLLTNPYFLPILLRFTCVPSANMITLMDAMPHGYFSFYWKGRLLKGFAMEVGTKPAFPQQYDFTLLCHPDVDPADLIN